LQRDTRERDRGPAGGQRRLPPSGVAGDERLEAGDAGRERFDRFVAHNAGPPVASRIEKRYETHERFSERVMRHHFTGTLRKPGVRSAQVARRA
jgi:hypothetical protein